MSKEEYIADLEKKVIEHGQQSVKDYEEIEKLTAALGQERKHAKQLGAERNALMEILHENGIEIDLKDVVELARQLLAGGSVLGMSVIVDESMSDGRIDFVQEGEVVGRIESAEHSTLVPGHCTCGDSTHCGSTGDTGS